MTFQVRTTVFEGPLDLLLQLITRHQLEISEVGITAVVAEYLGLLDELERLDIELTSEFLLIAATLVQLKTRALLPGSGELELDEELALIEERDRLLSRLLACVTFKDVAAVLQRRFQSGARYVPRTSGFDQQIRPVVVEVPVDIAELGVIASRVLHRGTEDIELDHLDLDLPSVEDAIGDLRARVEIAKLDTFDNLVSHCTTALEVAAYFLALLELARWGLIELSQQDWLSDIEVRDGGQGHVDLTSEWAK